jgi:predicted exporter
MYLDSVNATTTAAGHAVTTVLLLALIIALRLCNCYTVFLQGASLVQACRIWVFYHVAVTSVACLMVRVHLHDHTLWNTV